jgi:hypothetical protein
MRGNKVGREESLHKNLQEISREHKEVKQRDTRCRMRESLHSAPFT